MMDSNDLKNNLHQFTGTEKWYRNPLYQGMLYTDGIKFFAENAGNGAYWLLDIIGTEVFPIGKREPFIAISLTVENDKGLIEATDGNDNALYSRQIDFTDCPAGKWNFYLTNNVLLLPSEY